MTKKNHAKATRILQHILNLEHEASKCRIIKRHALDPKASQFAVFGYQLTDRGDFRKSIASLADRHTSAIFDDIAKLKAELEAL